MIWNIDTIEADLDAAEAQGFPRTLNEEQTEALLSIAKAARDALRERDRLGVGPQGSYNGPIPMPPPPGWDQDTPRLDLQPMIDDIFED